MLGIAAGIYPDVQVGDIVIAGQVGNYRAAEQPWLPGIEETMLYPMLRSITAEGMGSSPSMEVPARQVLRHLRLHLSRALPPLWRERQVGFFQRGHGAGRRS
jgi:hypothetical protein